MTPRGFRDVLPQEAAERDAIASTLADVYGTWGYQLVETPLVEDFATLEAGAGAPDSNTFRLFDSDGRLLALRPEMTVPIARLTASRLSGERGPHRLHYAADVFREQVSLRGQSRQFTQSGVEYIGASGPAADAEVVALLIESIAATGLADFTVALGTVEVLSALLAASRAPEEWQEAIRCAAHDRNLVEIDRLATLRDIPGDVGVALRAVVRLRGGREAIDQCREHLEACGCGAVLKTFTAMWDILETSGLTGHATVDFGTMRSFDYYTGLVFELLVPGLGLPLGGGGRYDTVLGAFGAPSAAAGFAVGIERLHIALSEQGVAPAVRRLDAIVCGGSASEVFAGAARLRAAGWRVRVAVGSSGAECVAAAHAAAAFEALSVSGGSIVRLDREGQPADPLREPLPAPPTLTADHGSGMVR
ncbi:MAG: ATP phosphoribosyltransferase regulatory subunit [Coriobacteriia bacterium]|jgi:ATP phosphoribosyltransferase regulatory subunit|nr:ATP phosphoribosyltransferase regulatory subunit [Coriobacteriia bacterium]